MANRIVKGRYKATKKQNADSNVPKPFFQTRFGRLPPEIRQMVFVELLATPPSYAGHDFSTVSSGSISSSRAPKKFVHIRASWHQVIGTCRQVYIEARPVFFACKSYYLVNSTELTCFLQDHVFARPTRPTFRWDTITALCVKGLVRSHPLYTQEQIDNIFSDPTNYQAVHNTREQLEAKTYQTLGAGIFWGFRNLNSLKTVCLCICVGEELLYINFLYGLTKMCKGVVEFVDASHWLVRPQNPEHEWKIQYACFINAAYGKGKDDEEIPYDRRDIEREMTDIDSRAPGLHKGDERYVEVQIQRHVADQKPQVPPGWDQGSMESETASDYTDEDLSGQNAQQTQLEIAEDQAEHNVLAEPSEDEGSIDAMEPEENSTDIDWLASPEEQREHGAHLQPSSNAELEEDHTSLRSASEEPSTARPESTLVKPEDTQLSRSSVQVTDTPLAGIENDQDLTRLTIPHDTDDLNEHIPLDAKASSQARQEPHSQHSDGLHLDGTSETKQTQEKIKEKAEGTVVRYRSISGNEPLLDIVDTPNPYTEEEMESYYNWQRSAGTQSPALIKLDLHREGKSSSAPIKNEERHEKDALVAGSTASSNDKDPPPDQSWLPSESVQVGVLLVFLLLLVVMNRSSECLSNASGNRKGSSQQ